MNRLIQFRCPATGLELQTLLSREEENDERPYQGLNCPSCTRLHFIDCKTGKLVREKDQGAVRLSLEERG